MNFFKQKSFESVKESRNLYGLPKNLTAFDLVILGLGGIIGTGIFVLTGLVAARYSGPAVMISYMIAGGTCIFVALAYTELATMLPTSGSIYTYSYVAFGEGIAWLAGSLTILELCFLAAAVAAGWSGYLQSIASLSGYAIPEALSKVPGEGGIINLPVVLIVFLVATVLFFGNKESSRVNALLVLVKLAAISVFVFVALPDFKIDNWSDFMPFGYDGMITGASILFFAFTGFSNIAVAAEECKNPKRDILFGIIISLILATILYASVGGLITGIVPYTELNTSQPLAHALALNGSNIGSAIVATGAIFGMPTVIMVNIYGISRIFYVIARDGLLPRSLARLHPKYNSPYLTIGLFSFIAACLGGFCPFHILSKLSSMGALIDYIIVIIAVIWFRLKMPHIYRSFKCPALEIIAPIALCISSYLLFKQFVEPNGTISKAGLVMLCWFPLMFLLYCIKPKPYKP